MIIRHIYKLDVFWTRLYINKTTKYKRKHKKKKILCSRERQEHMINMREVLKHKELKFVTDTKIDMEEVDLSSSLITIVPGQSE